LKGTVNVGMEAWEALKERYQELEEIKGDETMDANWLTKGGGGSVPDMSYYTKPIDDSSSLRPTTPRWDPGKGVTEGMLTKTGGSSIDYEQPAMEPASTEIKGGLEDPWADADSYYGDIEAALNMSMVARMPDQHPINPTFTRERPGDRALDNTYTQQPKTYTTTDAEFEKIVDELVYGHKVSNDRQVNDAWVQRQTIPSKQWPDWSYEQWVQYGERLEKIEEQMHAEGKSQYAFEADGWTIRQWDHNPATAPQWVSPDDADYEESKGIKREALEFFDANPNENTFEKEGDLTTPKYYVFRTLNGREPEPDDLSVYRERYQGVDIEVVQNIEEWHNSYGVGDLTPSGIADGKKISVFASQNKPNLIKHEFIHTQHSKLNTPLIEELSKIGRVVRDTKDAKVIKAYDKAVEYYSVGYANKKLDYVLQVREGKMSRQEAAERLNKGREPNDLLDMFFDETEAWVFVDKNSGRTITDLSSINVPPDGVVLGEDDPSLSFRLEGKSIFDLTDAELKTYVRKGEDSAATEFFAYAYERTQYPGGSASGPFTERESAYFDINHSEYLPNKFVGTTHTDAADNFLNAIRNHPEVQEALSEHYKGLGIAPPDFEGYYQYQDSIKTKSTDNITDNSHSSSSAPQAATYEVEEQSWAGIGGQISGYYEYYTPSTRYDAKSAYEDMDSSAWSTGEGRDTSYNSSYFDTIRDND
jgi:hypothetical protein